MWRFGSKHRLWKVFGSAAAIFMLENSPYRIVFCRVLKRDATKFEEALGKLKDKMILLGYMDYSQACDEIARMIDEGMKVCI